MKSLPSSLFSYYELHLWTWIWNYDLPDCPIQSTSDLKLVCRKTWWAALICLEGLEYLTCRWNLPCYLSALLMFWCWRLSEMSRSRLNPEQKPGSRLSVRKHRKARQIQKSVGSLLKRKCTLEKKVQMNSETESPWKCCDQGFTSHRGRNLRMSPFLLLSRSGVSVSLLFVLILLLQNCHGIRRMMGVVVTAM